MKSLLILLIALLTPATAWALGYEVGNGGDAVVCQTAGTLQVEILDFYEARVLYGMPLSLAGTDPVRIAEDALENFPPSEVARRLAYKKEIRDFLAQTLFVSDATLFEIADSHEAIVPRGCIIRQLAVQRQFGFGKRYAVQKDLWDAMPPVQQAGLILHEVIYAEAIALGHQDSLATRRMNIAIATGHFKDFSEENYRTVLAEEIGLPFLDRMWLEFPVGITLGGQTLTGTQAFWGGVRGIRFHGNSTPAFVEVSSAEVLLPALVSGRLEFRTRWVLGEIVFHPNGMVKQCKLGPSPFTLVIEKSGRLEPTSPYTDRATEAEFDENGILRRLGNTRY